MTRFLPAITCVIVMAVAFTPALYTAAAIT